MGIVVNVSEPGVDFLLYGDKSNILTNYLYNQIQALPKAFNEFSNKIYNSMLSSYNFIKDKLTRYGILNEIKSNGVNIIDNYFDELLTFKQLQEANLTMQRWVMAHNQIRQMYIDQNLDGYSETYKNIFGKEVGEKDYNYRMVMDGVIVPTEDGWYVKHYIQDLLPGDRELNHYEKTKILNTWDAMDWLLSNCQFDFTLKSDQPVKFNKV